MAVTLEHSCACALHVIGLMLRRHRALPCIGGSCCREHFQLSHVSNLSNRDEFELPPYGLSAMALLIDTDITDGKPLTQ